MGLLFSLILQGTPAYPEIIAGPKIKSEPLSSYSFDREKDFMRLVIDD